MVWLALRERWEKNGPVRVVERQEEKGVLKVELGLQHETFCRSSRRQCRFPPPGQPLLRADRVPEFLLVR